MLLPACASAPVVVKTVAPDLPPPTPVAVFALEQACQQDAPTCDWVVDLDKHYDKLEQVK